MNSHYQTASFYISSGTGNSLRVAGWMQKIADSQGLKTQRELVDKYIQKQELADSEEQLVCVFMPTHGFTAPWSVMKFASRMPRVSKTHAVVVATQGRLQFGKFFVPGLSASSTFIISLILTLKGYRVRGVQSVNMPSNWMALHSGQKLANIQRIVDKAQKPSEQFIIKILSCKRCWFSTLNNVEFILGLLLLPISIGYMIYGKEGLAKLFFVNHRCNGCGLCDEYCPNGAIQMNGKKQKYPFWTFRCESCMRCMAFCPEKAIEIHQNSFGNRSSIQRFIDIKACALCLLSGYLVSVFQTGFPAYTNSDRQPDFQLYNVDGFLPQIPGTNDKLEGFQ